jgi:hypothetical protein
MNRALLAACALVLAGCATLHREPPPEGSTSFGKPVVRLAAETYGRALVITAKWDRYGPYHFLVDTGSSVTLVTPELAARYASQEAPPPGTPSVRVRSSDGGLTQLPSTMLKRIELGEARFDSVPALIYDSSALSLQLGVKVDGVLGFPFFRKTLLTLDYPNGQVVLRPSGADYAAPGSPISFNNAGKTPMIPLMLGDRVFYALLDSGSDDVITLNPTGLMPRLAFGPTQGPTVGTLTGDRPEHIGRLAETVYIGGYAVPRPLIVISGDMTAIGGGLLKYFTVTFDQERDRVTFQRNATDPIAIPAWRSTGLSFSKTPAYWRVAGVVPGSPADEAGVEEGDLVTRINGEAVPAWDLRRYERLTASAASMTVSFLRGTSEITKELRIVELVP